MIQKNIEQHTPSTKLRAHMSFELVAVGEGKRPREEESEASSDEDNGDEEFRFPGKIAVRLSTAAVHQVALRFRALSQEILYKELVGTGKDLASVVVPLKDRDEAVFKEKIMTNREVFPEMYKKLNSSPLPFLRQFSEKTLEIQFSPSGLVSFGLKLDRFLGSGEEAAGDLVAEAAALALSPQKNKGGKIVFASSVSEIDGTGCGITESGCRAIAEEVLKLRKDMDDILVHNECVRALLLGGNINLKDAGARAIAAALKPIHVPCKGYIFNKTLTVLDMSKCDIGPEGALAIAKALKPRENADNSWSFPSNLRVLNLSGNRIKSQGARAIAGLLGPKENRTTHEWMFNPSLAVIDLSSQFSGMDASVALAFKEALEPRQVVRRPGGEGGSATHSVNNFLVELNLRDHAFKQEAVDMLKKTLDPMQNGSNGTVAAPTRLLVDLPWPPVNNENEIVTDKLGNSNELVMPIASVNEGHFRPMTYWRWKTWNVPFSGSTDKPNVGPPPRGQPTGALAKLIELTRMPSFGLAIRTELERLVDARDYSLPEWIDEEDITCVICQEIFIDPYFVNGCGHRFCFQCILFALSQQRKPSCPICRFEPLLGRDSRQAIANNLISPSRETEKWIARHVLPNLSPEKLKERQDLVVDRMKSMQERIDAEKARRAAVRNATT